MEPGRGFPETVVDVVDVLDALVAHPVFESRGTALAVNRDSLLPGSASAQHSREIDSRLRRPAQRFRELLVADAGAEVDKGPRGKFSSLAEMLEGLFLAVGSLPR